MTEGQRAGLVGTNTVRQNYSREGGLDYIVANGGTIIDAVSTQVWSGDAVVHVSLVNWLKGDEGGKKRLAFQRGDAKDSPFEYHDLEEINSALSLATNLSSAVALRANSESHACYQGQTHGHKGFLLSQEDVNKLSDASRVFPYLIGDELLSYTPSMRFRYVADLNQAQDIFEAQKHRELYEILKDRVFPTMQKNADDELKKTGKHTGPRQSHFRKWWKFWRARDEMIGEINKQKRYIACSRVTKRPIFEFISSDIHPNDALQVFPLADDYSFGILQSTIHWEWFIARCSTLKADFRYTSDTVFDSFPWPQTASKSQVRKVAECAVTLRATRQRVMRDQNIGLRSLYRIVEESPGNPVSVAQEKLDVAVMVAYGMKKTSDILAFLLSLNNELATKEHASENIVRPGLPAFVTSPQDYTTEDCIRMPLNA